MAACPVAEDLMPAHHIACGSMVAAIPNPTACALGSNAMIGTLAIAFF
jgi:hypothetical protein